MTTDKGTHTERKTVKQQVYLGGMCPRCEGMGQVSDIDLTALYDDSKTLLEGALTVPGYSMDGWYGRLFEGMGLPMDKVVVTVQDHGNTSAASIPLALSVGKAKGQIKRGDLVVTEAIGGGLAWGSVVIRW